MPNLFSFTAPPSLSQFSFDTSEEFFSGEVDQGNLLYTCIENYLSSGPSICADFSPQTCWRLQRAFVSGFLRWMPIFDDEACFQHVQIASASEFSEKSASSCLTLLMFAIGAMSVDEHLYSEDPYALPGFQYLALAYKILNLGKAPMGDIAHLQCRCLLSQVLLHSPQGPRLIPRKCILELRHAPSPILARNKPSNKRLHDNAPHKLETPRPIQHFKL